MPSSPVRSQSPTCPLPCMAPGLLPLVAPPCCVVPAASGQSNQRSTAFYCVHSGLELLCAGAVRLGRRQVEDRSLPIAICKFGCKWNRCMNFLRLPARQSWR